MNTMIEQRDATQLTMTPVVRYAASTAHALAPVAHDLSLLHAPVGSMPERIRVGSRVVCRDGTAGTVTHVLDADQGAGPHIVVRRGWLRARRYVVPLHNAVEITPQQVVLNCRIRDIEAQPPYRPDDEIREAVEQIFHGVPAFEHPDFLTIKVTVHGGVVDLRGSVRTARRRIDAEHLARGVPGVRSVRNWLVADDALAQQAERALRHDRRLVIDALQVQCFFGLVHLRGTVADPLQRALAALVVQRVEGVHAVNNALHVCPTLVPAVQQN